ncbi:dTMP kinase [Candidatus Saganbacteria bacterium CG08_land_8_20_14_0_20_45_16]|uniref:Thymidylate kinase n=1 Tax=Candidatus Saganbacteria bacterium CG08_land_8_20_14_0_20_45_16 TaxID=2014293 RepID=A0A2H0XXE8_UNCSA|nr:MAG: dTMP kinase [Candidatus Saganbacteria bacterium CG08_land_8_20_14_0_20_45_16]
MFITFEGVEGCGKTTHIKLLKEFLEEQGRNAILTREPGGTYLGKQLRQLLLDPQSVIDETTEVYLFAADRVDHLNKIILPALAEGRIVLCDRYVDSTLAYQVGGRSLPEDFVRYLNMVSSKGQMPDLTILLDVTAEVGLARAGEQRVADRFESEKKEFHQRVRNKYLEIAKNEPERVRIVSTDEASIEEVQEDIRDIVEGRL